MTTDPSDDTNELLWYYTDQGNQYGPILESELRRLAQEGKLLPTDLVWNGTMGDQWAEASTMPSLFEKAPILSGDSTSSQSQSHEPGSTPNKELMAKARASLKGRWGIALGITLIYLAIFMVIGGIRAGFTIPYYIHAAAAIQHTSHVAGSLPIKPQVTLPLEANIVSWVLQLIQFLITAPLIIGLITVFLKIARRQEVQITALFQGFHILWKAIGTYLLILLLSTGWMLLFLLPAIALFGSAATTHDLQNHTIKIFLYIIGGLGMIAATSFIYYYSLTFFILADDLSVRPLHAIRKSKAMMKGMRWKLFCLNLRFIGWYLVGIFTCCIGWIWIMPYLMTAQTHFYLDLKNQTEDPVDEETTESVTVL